MLLKKTMRIAVKVIPNAREEKVEMDNNKLKVYVRAKPVRGEANKSVIEILAKHFGIKKSKIRILKGFSSREKIVEVLK